MYNVIRNYLLKRKINNNVEYTLFNILNLLKMRYTTTTFKSFKENIDYPNPISLLKFLNIIGIQNLITKTKVKDLIELPPPFIIITKTPSNFYQVIARIDKKKATIINGFGKKKSISFSELSEIYTDKAIILDASGNKNQVIEENYNRNIFSDILTFLIIPLFILIFFSLCYFKSPESIYWYFFFFSSLIGVIITSLINIADIDKNNPYVKKVCGAKENGSSCNDVLNSSVAILFGEFSWAGIGLIYMISIFIYLIISNHINSLSIIGSISILVFPFIFYSIYHQYRLKSWCKLCLIVLGVISFNFILSCLFFIETGFTFPILQFLTLCLIFIFAGLSYSKLKPIIKNSSIHKVKIKGYEKIIFNDKVFNSVISQQPKYNIKDAIPLVYGNLNSKHSITIITNPLCKYCADIYMDLSKIILDKKNIMINEIFYTDFIKNENDLKVSSRSISSVIDWHQNKSSDFYSNKYHFLESEKFRDWAIHFQNESNGISADNFIEVQKHNNEWFNKNKLPSIPVILYDGFLVPNFYTVNDLNAFIK